MSAITTIIEDVVALPRWIKGTGAIVIAGLLVDVGYQLWAHHERNLGARACEDRIAALDKAQAEDLKDMQAKIDHDAAEHDSALRDAINSVPRATPKIPFDPHCQLTTRQISEIREALQ